MTYLADTRVTDEKELEEVVVFAGVHIGWWWWRMGLGIHVRGCGQQQGQCKCVSDPHNWKSAGSGA